MWLYHSSLLLYALVMAGHLGGYWISYRSDTSILLPGKIPDTAYSILEYSSNFDFQKADLIRLLDICMFWKSTIIIDGQAKCTLFWRFYFPSHYHCFLSFLF